MKLQLASSEGNFITGSGPGWVRIGTQEFRENLVLTADVIQPGWAAAGIDALTEADYAGLLALRARSRGAGHRRHHPLSASAAHAGADRGACRRRGDGHGGRVPDVQRAHGRGPKGAGGADRRLSRRHRPPRSLKCGAARVAPVGGGDTFLANDRFRPLADIQPRQPKCRGKNSFVRRLREREGNGSIDHLGSQPDRLDQHRTLDRRARDILGGLFCGRHD